MTTKTYKFRTPSNQLIIIDDKYAYRMITTIADLKYLFTLKNRLYSINDFEIALNNKTLELNTIISSLDVDEYTIIHIMEERDIDSYYIDVPEEQSSSAKLKGQSSFNVPSGQSSEARLETHEDLTEIPIEEPIKATKEEPIEEPIKATKEEPIEGSIKATKEEPIEAPSNKENNLEDSGCKCQII